MLRFLGVPFIFLSSVVLMPRSRRKVPRSPKHKKKNKKKNNNKQQWEESFYCFSCFFSGFRMRALVQEGLYTMMTWRGTRVVNGIRKKFTVTSTFSKTIFKASQVRARCRTLESHDGSLERQKQTPGWENKP